MSTAAALLDRLGRPGGLRLGPAQPLAVARLSTGLPALDSALGGGLPRGRITELAGPRSTGRTGLACAIAARATAAGETIGWIDPDDALDPEAVTATGIILDRTLWVRTRNTADAFRAAEVVLGAGGFGLVVLDVDRGRATPGVWPRLARAAERARATLLVVAARPGAGNLPALWPRLTARHRHLSRGAGRPLLLDGVD